MQESVIEKQFYRYVIPSICTMVLGGFYTIVDGYFIGNAMGDVGLAAINLGWPIPALVYACASGIGIGGSVLISTYMGEKNIQLTNKAKGNTLTLLAVASVLLMVLLAVFADEVLVLLGAKDLVYTYGYDYIKVLTIGASLQIFGTGCTPILRNSNRSVQAMIIMITGLFTNIFLDWYLVSILDLKMSGAALATILAQGVACVSCLWLILKDEHKLKKYDFRLDKGIVKNILRVGISPFGLSISPSLVIVCANWQCLRVGGETAVAAYSVISYLLCPMQEILRGVGEGVQPLISFCNGAGKTVEIKHLLKKTNRLVSLLAILLGVFMFTYAQLLPAIFKVSYEASEMIVAACRIISFAFIFIGIVKTYSAYFYAIREPRASSILIYGESLVVTPILMFALPQVLGLNGIWSVTLVNAIFMACLSLLLNKQLVKKHNLS